MNIYLVHTRAPLGAPALSDAAIRCTGASPRLARITGSGLPSFQVTLDVLPTTDHTVVPMTNSTARGLAPRGRPV